MTPEELQKLEYHANQIAQILYSDTDPKVIQTLGDIEVTVRQKILQHVSPPIGVFLSELPPKPKPEESEPSKPRSGSLKSRNVKPKCST